MEAKMKNEEQMEGAAMFPISRILSHGCWTNAACQVILSLSHFGLIEVFASLIQTIDRHKINYNLH